MEPLKSKIPSNDTNQEVNLMMKSLDLVTTFFFYEEFLTDLKAIVDINCFVISKSYTRICESNWFKILFECTENFYNINRSHFYLTRVEMDTRSETLFYYNNFKSLLTFFEIFKDLSHMNDDNKGNENWIENFFRKSFLFSNIISTTILSENHLITKLPGNYRFRTTKDDFCSYFCDILEGEVFQHFEEILRTIGFKNSYLVNEYSQSVDGIESVIVENNFLILLKLMEVFIHEF